MVGGLLGFHIPITRRPPDVRKDDQMNDGSPPRLGGSTSATPISTDFELQTALARCRGVPAPDRSVMYDDPAEAAGSFAWRTYLSPPRRVWAASFETSQPREALHRNHRRLGDVTRMHVLSSIKWDDGTHAMVGLQLLVEQQRCGVDWRHRHSAGSRFRRASGSERGEGLS